MMWALISKSPSSNTWNSPNGPAPTMTASVSIGPSCVLAVFGISTLGFGSMVSGKRELLLQLRQLAGAVFPFVGVGRRRLALGDARPAALGQLGIQLDHVLLVARNILLRHDRVDGALGDADGAVDAFVGVDGQKVRPFAKAVDRAHIHTVGVL